MAERIQPTPTGEGGGEPVGISRQTCLACGKERLSGDWLTDSDDELENLCMCPPTTPVQGGYPKMASDGELVTRLKEIADDREERADTSTRIDAWELRRAALAIREVCRRLVDRASVPTPPASRGTGVPTLAAVIEEVEHFARVAGGRPLEAELAKNDLIASIRTLSAAAEQGKATIAQLRDDKAWMAEEIAAMRDHIEKSRAAAEQGERDREDAERFRGLEQFVVRITTRCSDGYEEGYERDEDRDEDGEEFREWIDFLLKNSRANEAAAANESAAARPPHEGRA